MPRKPRKPREYRFEIDAFTPDTIPMSRLSQYLGDIARMMGEESSVHLSRVDKGSTDLVIRIDWEAEPKVRDRIRAVKFNEGPAEARRAFREINKKLVEDNASGVLRDPAKSKVIRFPGSAAANQVEFGPIAQAGYLQGVVNKIGGEHDPVPVHLEDGTEKHIIWAARSLAKDLAPHLFTSVVRVGGVGRWLRNRTGEWELRDFHAQSFEVIPDGDIRANLTALRSLDVDWKKTDDPLNELMSMRGYGRPQ